MANDDTSEEITAEVTVRELEIQATINQRESTEDGEKILSPFVTIDGAVIQFAWDSTSLGWLKRCPRLYYYHMYEGWQPSDESADLRFGIEFHKCTYDYEILKADGIAHDEALFHVIRELLLRIDDWNPDHQYKNPPNLIRSVIWYLDKFENDPAKTYILDNGKPAVEVSFRFNLDFGPPYVICGHLDRIVEYQNALFDMDYKTTTKTLGSYFFDQFEPDNQMSLYTLASKVILNVPIKGVIINGIQVAIDFTRPVRGITYRTDEQLDEWLNDLRYWITVAESYAKAGYWPMNDTACDKYGGCAFRKICSKSPSVREAFLKADFVKRERPWNPLEIR